VGRGGILRGKKKRGKGKLGQREGGGGIAARKELHLAVMGERLKDLKKTREEKNLQ